MISSRIINTDKFFELTSQEQMLYVLLIMNADDDGFLGNANMIARSIKANGSDLQALIDQKYLYAFEDGAICVKDWLIHNTIRKDRYTPTVYQEDFKKLKVSKNQQYELVDEAQPITESEKSSKLVAISDKTEAKKEKSTDKKKEKTSGAYVEIVDYLNNKLAVKYPKRQFKATSADTRKKIHARLAEGFTVDDFKKVIDNKCNDWLDDENYNIYLRPKTLFSEKFETYLTQSSRPGNYSSFRNASKAQKNILKPIDWNQYAKEHQRESEPKMSTEEMNQIFRDFGPNGKIEKVN